MELRNTLSRNSGVIAQIVFTGVLGFLPLLTSISASQSKEEKWEGLLFSAGLLTLGFLISIFVLHKLSILQKEEDDGENEYKKQWKLYARLYECQKEHQRAYFYVATLSIACLLFFLTLSFYYGKDAISIIMQKWWWAIPLYFAGFLIIALYCIWEIYYYKINYYSNDSIQLLWEEIEKLGRKLGLNDIQELKEELGKSGNKEKFEDMIFEYGIGYQPKDYIEQTKEMTKDIMNLEIMIIEHLETTIKKKKEAKEKQCIVKKALKRFLPIK